MNKKATFYKYAKLYTYILKNAAFNRQFFPRGSAIAKGMAHQAWKVHNDSWDKFGKQIGPNGRLTPQAQEARKAYVNNELKSLESKYTPHSNPASDYAIDVTTPYDDTITRLQYSLEGLQLSPQEFAQRALAYQKYNTAQMYNGTSIRNAAIARRLVENQKQFFARNVDPTMRPFVQNIPVSVKYTKGVDNGSSAIGDNTVYVTYGRPGLVLPTTFGHEAAHANYGLEKADPLTENAVAQMLDRAPVGGSKSIGDYSYIDKDKTITMPDGTKLDAYAVRVKDEFRANEKQREAVERAIAEGLQNGTMTPGQAKAIRTASILEAQKSNSGYAKLIGETMEDAPPLTARQIRAANRAIEANNKANGVNINTMLDVKPADRIWHGTHDAAIRQKGAPISDTKIGTIDAVIDKLDTYIAHIESDIDRNRRFLGEDMLNSRLNNLNNLKAQKQWLLDNKASIQQSMRDIRKANRIEGKGIALQNEMAKLKKTDEYKEYAKMLAMAEADAARRPTIWDRFRSAIGMPRVPFTKADAINANREIADQLNALQSRYDTTMSQLDGYPMTTRQWVLNNPELMANLEQGIY